VKGRKKTTHNALKMRDDVSIFNSKRASIKGDLLHIAFVASSCCMEKANVKMEATAKLFFIILITVYYVKELETPVLVNIITAWASGSYYFEGPDAT